MDAIAVVAALGYVYVVWNGLAGVDLGVGAFLLPIPPLLGILMIFRRKPLTRTQSLALAFCTLLLLALLTAFVVQASWLTVLIIPLMAVFGVLCARYPSAAVLSVLFFSGAFGSLHALIGFPAAKFVDPLVGGLWLAAIWVWLTGSRGIRARANLWPGVIVLIVYGLLTGTEILSSYKAIAGLQSFRASTWYLGSAILVAYAPWPEHVTRRLLRGAILVAAFVGAYATFRWLVGPAGSERALAQQSANNVLDSELRPTGSFATSKELSAWTAMVIPFMAAMALVLRDRWRLVAIAAVGLCVTGMMAADVRAGPAAAAGGTLVVLVLYQLAQGFRGRRGATLAIAICAAALLGGGAFALTLGSKSDSGRRYQAILNPGSDASYQARLFKWRAAIDSIQHTPFGHGLGTSGRVQKRYGQYANIGSIDVDNSYLKIAYEQGFFVMGMLAAGLLLLLGGLARRAVVTLDPARAGPAIGAAGTLVAMLVLFFIAEYIEGLPALAGWLLVGLGMRHLTLGPDETPAA